MAKKHSSSLDARIREIRDSDEFVEHVRNIQRRYKREYALSANDVQRELRRSIRDFHKHAAGLVEFTETAQSGKRGAIERDALRLLTEATTGPAGDLTLAWLRDAARAAEVTLEQMKIGNQAVARVRALCAEALRATFEHHDIKFVPGSAKKPGDVAQLLLQLGKSAGDVELSLEEARQLCATAKKGPAAVTHVSTS